MTAVNVYKQRPDNIQGQSPLHHAGLTELVGKGRAGAGIRLREKKLRGHLTLRGDAHDPAFVKGVNQALGMELPVALTLVANGETSLQWMGPDEWLLIVPQGEEFATEQRLRDALAGQHIQVVNVSGGQTLIELSGKGPRAADEVDTLRRAPEQLPGGQGRGHPFRQEPAGDPAYR